MDEEELCKQIEAFYRERKLSEGEWAHARLHAAIFYPRTRTETQYIPNLTFTHLLTYTYTTKQLTHSAVEFVFSLQATPASNRTCGKASGWTETKWLSFDKPALPYWPNKLSQPHQPNQSNRANPQG